MKRKLKSPAYLKWVQQFPCLICELAGMAHDQATVSPHHLPLKGYTRKYQDFNNVVPLCYNHHTGPSGLHKNPKSEKNLLPILKKVAARYTKEYERGKR